MASIVKLRSLTTSFRHFQPRHLSSILNPNSTTTTTTTTLSAKDKSRAALSLLKTEKNPNRIIEICRSASLTPESHLDRIALSIAIQKLTDLKHFDGIHNFIQELLKTRPDLNNEKFIAHAIVYYGQAGLLDHAFQLFDEMPQLGIARNAKSLNALLFSCKLAEKFDELERVFLEFPSKYNVTPDLDTYNTVIKAFCESGSSGSCYRVIDEMVRKNCRPNAATFGVLISGFYREENLDEVGKVLELMKKLEIPIGIGTYNVRIQSLCKLKKTIEAKELLDGVMLSGMKPNSASYCHLIHGFCKEGRLDEARELFDKMIGGGFKPDSDCYFTLVNYACRGRDFDLALRVCKQSMEKDWVPNFSTMKLLVEGLGNGLRVGEAKELVREMKERFPKNAHMWNEVEEKLRKAKGEP